jgi:regulator of PEP synthase PpsR (kinase-PPPase family)
MTKALTVHIVSDSTGGTAASAVRAVGALFDRPYHEVPHVFTRSKAQIDEIIAAAQDPDENSLIVYTLTDYDLRDHLERGSADTGITIVPLLSPLIQAFRSVTQTDPKRQPGQQYRVNEAYMDRIAALDFAMAHDDGFGLDYLLAADVILVGVSRTSKTPTCIYLAYQGVRAANVPLIPNQPPSDTLIDALKAGVPAVGLIATPNRLSQIRQHRLTVLDRNDTPEYAAIDRVREEVAEARLFFDRYNLPIIDVTRRSIEETAAGIRAILRDLRS